MGSNIITNSGDLNPAPPPPKHQTKPIFKNFNICDHQFRWACSSSSFLLLRSIFFVDGTDAEEVGRDGSIDESIYNARDGPSLQQHVELRVVPGGVVLRRSVSRSRLWKSRCCFAQRRSGVVFHGRLHVQWRILLGLRSGIHCGRRLEHCLRAASRTTVPGTPPKGKVGMLQITIKT